MNPGDFDLNLLVTFEAIYEARNLTRAGEVVGLSQPAMSNALGRLRNAFDDQLFVRTRDGMVPTPAARAMIGPVRQALKLVEESVRHPRQFDPATAERTFRISMEDLTEAQLLPPLLALLDRQAPRLTVESFRVPRRDVPREFSAGSLDFVIDVPLLSDPNVRHEVLLSDRYVCLVRAGHPDIGSELDLDTFLDLRHILISSRPRGGGHVDLALERLGLRRRIALRAQHYLMAPAVVADTDMALTVPLGFASTLAHNHSLRVLELPFEVPPLESHLYWHASADADPANLWFRALLRRLVGHQSAANVADTPTLPLTGAAVD